MKKLNVTALILAALATACAQQTIEGPSVATNAVWAGTSP